MFDNLGQTFAHLKVACENTQAGGEEGRLFSQANHNFFSPSASLKSPLGEERRPYTREWRKPGLGNYIVIV